jgi:hypothetical protein
MIDDIIQVLPTIAKYFNELFPEELNQMKSHVRLSLSYE